MSTLNIDHLGACPPVQTRRSRRGQGRLGSVRRDFQLGRREPRSVSAAASTSAVVNETAPEIARIDAELRKMMDAGDVRSARRLLADLDPAQQAHPEIVRWTRALRPPEVSLGAPASASRSSMEKNAAWLRAHSATYSGQWVALRDGELLGSHPNHLELHRDLVRRDELRGALFVRIATG